MKAYVTKLTTVVAMAMVLVLGSTGETTAAAPISCAKETETGGRVDNGGTRVIEVSTDRYGTPRAGHMVGQFFVGFLPE
jgi:hypothetical protein